MSKLNLTRRGFSEVREKVNKSNKFIRSCYNCEFYYQAPGDKDECCQNQNVTKYDLVVTENNICCSYWKPVQIKVQRGPKTVKELFMQRKQGGR